MKNILFLLCIFCSYALAADWALISAVAGNETAKVLQILNDNPNAINARSGCGASLLFFSLTPEMTELLIMRGVDVNARDNWGNTELITAVRAGSPDIVRILLQHQADPTIVNNHGDSALNLRPGFGYLGSAGVEAINRLLAPYKEKAKKAVSSACPQ